MASRRVSKFCCKASNGLKTCKRLQTAAYPWCDISFYAGLNTMSVHLSKVFFVVATNYHKKYLY